MCAKECSVRPNVDLIELCILIEMRRVFCQVAGVNQKTPLQRHQKKKGFQRCMQICDGSTRNVWNHRPPIDLAVFMQ